MSGEVDERRLDGARARRVERPVAGSLLAAAVFAGLSLLLVAGAVMAVALASAVVADHASRVPGKT